MKKVLLFIAMAACSATYLSAQNVVWSEEFAGGSQGWSVNTLVCDGLTGPAIGRWTLTSATRNGTAIPNLTGEFAVNTQVEYSVRFSDGTNRAEAQARYTLAGNVWTSNLNGEAIPLADTNYLYNPTNRQTLYFTHLNMSQSAFNEWGATFLGLNNPSFVIAPGATPTLTITSSDNAVQLVFTKASNCGVLWWWTHNGSVRSGSLFNSTVGEVNINSPTANNGAMVLNADFLTSRGSQANLPSGPPYPVYISELISPIIDLSDVDEGLSLSFYQLVRFLNVPAGAPAPGVRTWVAFSTDGGVTWSAPINANEGLQANTAVNNQRILTLPGIQGSANARIKFVWQSEFYYWALDDIRLVEQPRNDLRVNNFFAIAPNSATPVTQLEPFGFVADIQNVGSRPQQASTLTVTIRNATDQIIYADSIPYGLINPGDTIENVFFPNEFLPPPTPGAYTGRYTISIDGLDDEQPANNIQEFPFSITENTFSKENGVGLGSFNFANLNNSWGNIYYVPNGAGFAANTVSFAVANANQLAGRTATILFYKWNGDANRDFRVEPAEYDNVPIAFNFYEFTGMEGSNLITVPVSQDADQVPLEDNSYYFPVIQYSTDDNVRMNLLASNRFSYSAAWFYSDSLQKPRYASALDVGNSGIYTMQFGAVPVVRLNIGPLVSVKDQALPETAFEVYPNPASDVVNLKLTLDRPQDIQIAVFDQFGRALTVRKFQQVNRDIIDMPVHKLPSGTYYIKVTTPDGTAVRTIVVAK